MLPQSQLIGFVILGLVLLALRRGTLSQQKDLRRRSQQKEQIIRLLRLRLCLTAESCAPELGVDRYRAAALARGAGARGPARARTRHR